MKIFKFLAIGTILLTFGCKEGYIDDITTVEPGPDEVAPTVDITNPVDDVIIPFTDTTTSLSIELEVVDDIEIGSIVLSLNGSELKRFSDFKDYRRVLESYLYEDLPVGDHVIEVVANDLDGKSTTESLAFEVSNKYVAKYDGEVFYMPFEGELYMELINEVNSTVIENPGFADGQIGEAYEGAEGAFLRFSTEGLLNDEFSAVFWYNVNADPDRAGILVIGPPDPANPDGMNNRTSGFRFFREGSATNQIFKLNVGRGDGDVWFDGGAAASLDPNSAGWTHMAFTISNTECVVYINGEEVKQGDFPGVDWTGCDSLSIMSGAPRFTGWNHLSDQSLIDELRLFNKALTQQEIQAIIDAES